MSSSPPVSGTAPLPPTPRLSNIAAIDGLRGISILLVLLCHLPTDFFLGGFVGVDTFFVLSGFLITTTLLRGFEQKGRAEFAHFYGRRILRLWPALFLCLLLARLLWEVELKADKPDFTRAALAALLNCANWLQIVVPRSMGLLTHTWSLSIEEQFYMVWPLSLWLLLARGREPTQVLLGIIAATWLLRPLLGAWLQLDPAHHMYHNSFIRMDELLAGSTVALLLAKGPREVPALRWLQSAPAAWAAVCVLLVATKVSRETSPLYYAVGIPLVTLAAVALVSHAVSAVPGTLKRLLESAPLTFLGKRSYGLYLYHFPIFFTVMSYRTAPTRNNFITYSLAVLAATLVVASLSFPLEEAIIRRGRRWLDARLKPGRTAEGALLAGTQPPST
jgi:peptidoglycan/LPS O-acetylase OafA/YrhL